MNRLVLRDGRTIDLSPEQYDAYVMVLLYSQDIHREVKVGSERFNLDDVVTDPDEILRITQLKMFDVPHIAQKPTKGKKKLELSWLF